MKILWMFPVIGALALAGAAALQAVRLSDEAQMVASTAQVIDVTDGCPTVEFSTEHGQPVEYRSHTCSNPPSFRRGEEVRVYYSAENPNEARIDSFIENWLSSLILGGVGTIFLLVGGAFVLPGILSRRRAAELAVTGLPVEADLVEVRLNTALTVNGRNPWKIVAQWQNPATQKLHIFNSDNIWFDPNRFVSELTQVRVLIDRQNPKRYSMDTGFLPDIVE